MSPSTQPEEDRAALFEEHVLNMSKKDGSPLGYTRRLLTEKEMTRVKEIVLVGGGGERGEAARLWFLMLA